MKCSFLLLIVLTFGGATAGYSQESPDPRSVLMWALLGPSIVNSNQQYLGATFSAGLEFFSQTEHRWSFGFFLGKPSSAEKARGGLQGDISRYDIATYLRHYVNGGSFFSSAVLGASYIVCSQEQVGSRLDPLFGVGVGYVLMKSRLQELNLQLSYEYVSGDVTPFPYTTSESSSSAAISSAGITTLGLSYGFFLP